MQLYEMQDNLLLGSPYWLWARRLIRIASGPSQDGRRCMSNVSQADRRNFRFQLLLCLDPLSVLRLVIYLFPFH